MTLGFIFVNGLILTIFCLVITLAIAVRQNKKLCKELEKKQEK